MKKFMLLCVSCLAIYTSITAQSTVDKTVYKANEAILKAENAKNTLDKLKGWLPKKKKKVEDTAVITPVPVKEVPKLDTSAHVFGNGTQVSVSGIDYSMLKKLNENILACEGVISTKLKFGVALSTIDVVHTGTTEKLLQLMEATSKDIFTSKQLQSMEEGKISIKIQ